MRILALFSLRKGSIPHYIGSLPTLSCQFRLNSQPLAFILLYIHPYCAVPVGVSDGEDICFDRAYQKISFEILKGHV